MNEKGESDCKSVLTCGKHLLNEIDPNATFAKGFSGDSVDAGIARQQNVANVSNNCLKNWTRKFVQKPKFGVEKVLSPKFGGTSFDKKIELNEQTAAKSDDDTDDDTLTNSLHRSFKDASVEPALVTAHLLTPIPSFQSKKRLLETNLSPKMRRNNESIGVLVLLGCLVGLLISKALKCLQIFVLWCKMQMMKFRFRLFGPISFLDFLGARNTGKFNKRNKLFLLPIIGICCLTNRFLAFVNFLLNVLLAQAPNNLVAFVNFKLN